MIAELVMEEMPSSGTSLIPHDLAVNFVVNMLMTLIIWWIDQNQYFD